MKGNMNDIKSIFKQDEYTRPELSNLFRISYQRHPDNLLSRVKSRKVKNKYIYKKEDIIKYLESIN